MSTYKVSAVIPAFNAQETIVRCLDSIVHQTVKVYEILVVDDGSTDETANIIENFIKANTQANIILFKQKNAGPSSARNLAISKAKGDLIAFLDADDVWLSHKNALQLSVFERLGAGLSLVGSMHPFVKNKRLQQAENVIGFKKMLFGNCFSTSTVVVSKERLASNNFDVHQKYSEDYGLWLKLALQGKCILLSETVTKADKPIFGYKGLSSQLWKMEKGELRNFAMLFKNNNIQWYEFYFFAAFSFLKYIRRLIVSGKN